ncbi:amino acid permease [Kockovaella imperatae]|uniref:Amino acid permease n=1 Tax=Kockovaella imperatae TaxID=4999 RepID=A0A1Y1UBZ9_9TREE|nr:amino acid permease [Kockovaella imperatae]ORX35532.1 amino acid permease [Kockovaella imperatae]
MNNKEKTGDQHVHLYGAETYPEDGANRDIVPLEGSLHRGLKPRHVSLIAIGGVIGTGLFIGTGTALSNGGPVGLWLGFSLFGVLTFFMMLGLGEMCAYLPITGGQLTYAGRFFDPALGFALTWSTTIHWALTCASELSAVAVLVNYWLPVEKVNNAAWIAISYAVIVVLNLTTSGVYGETEFIFSSIKVLTIVGLIILGVCIDCGAGPTGHYIGFHFWKDPGPFAQYLGIPGTTGRFLGFWAVFIQAAFSQVRYGGVEFFAISAAESANPRLSIPRAMKQIYVRIGVFYILGTIILSLLVPYTNNRLGTASNAAASPWVIAIQLSGIKALPHIINACLITSAWSAANADLYISSRCLYNMAHKGLVPKVFLRTHRYGTPYVAVLTMGLIPLLAFMTVSTGAAEVFGWFVNLVSVMGLCEWTAICVSYLGFRRAWAAQGFNRDSLPYKHRLALPGAYICCAFFPLIIFFSAWQVFRHTGRDFDRAAFVTNYLPAFWFLVMYSGYKLYARTRVIAPTEVDLVSNLAEIEATIEERPDSTTFSGKLRTWFF